MRKFKKDFDITAIASSLEISTDAVLKEFKDGRVISRFTEHWCAELYNFVKNDSSDAEGFDGFIPSTGGLGNQKIAVRTLTARGIKFQQSKYIGSGRQCTQDNLIESLQKADYELVVDCTDFPIVLFIPIKTSDLIILAMKDGKKGVKILNPRGLSASDFYMTFFGQPKYKITFDNPDLAK
jgi:hypothetical protein